MKTSVMSCIAAAAFLSACDDSVNTPEVLEILEAEAEALGGLQRLRSINTLRGKSQILDNDGSYSFSYIIDRSGFIRLESANDTGVFHTETLTPDDAWLFAKPAGASDLKDESIARLNHAVIDTFTTGRERINMGYRYEYMGTRELGSKKGNILKETAPDGGQLLFYYDDETSLVSCWKRLTNGKTWPDAEELKQEHCFTEYRWIDGFNVPVESVHLYSDTREVVWSMALLEYEVNPELDMSLFERPEN